MFRQALPGEIWRINSLEAHCLLMALERFEDFFHEESFLPVWRCLLIKETAKYDPALSGEDQPYTSLTPIAQDRDFMNKLIEKERAHLAFHDATYVLNCRHQAREHEIILSDWVQRELKDAEKFASSVRSLQGLSPEKKLEALYSPLALSREDAERIIEEEVRAYRFRRIQRDMETLEQLETMNRDGTLPEDYVFDHQKTIESLKRAREAGEKDVREQLFGLMEKYILK